jgi:hypothetical protein
MNASSVSRVTVAGVGKRSRKPMKPVLRLERHYRANAGE